MPFGSPSSSTVPVDVPATAIGVSSSTTTLTVPVAVTVSPSLSVACTRPPKLMVRSFSVLVPSSTWSSGLSSVNVHAPVDASSAIVNTVLPAPAVAVIRFAPIDVAQRNAARRQHRPAARHPPC